MSEAVSKSAFQSPVESFLSGLGSADVTLHLFCHLICGHHNLVRFSLVPAVCDDYFPSGILK